MAMVALLIAVGAIMAFLSPLFLTASNLLGMTRFFVEIGLIALGMTLVILTAGIDLSVGSMVGLATVVLGLCYRMYLPIGAAVLLALMAGSGAGLLNGLLISRANIPPLIVTLATLAIYRGLALGISQAEPVRDFPESFSFLGQGYLLGVPVQFLIFLAFAAGTTLLLGRTSIGRYIYAIGNNEAAARFAGIEVDRLKLFLYTFNGFLSGLAAVIYVSRVSTAKADAGQGYELDVITAVVLGGTSIAGGEGSILGTVLGLVLITTLRNGLTMARFPSEGQAVIIGALLILSVALDRLMRRKSDGF